MNVNKSAAALLGLASVGMVALAQPPKSDPSPTPVPPKVPAEPGDVIETMRANKDLSTLVGALDATGLAEALQAKDKKFTIFAPSNAAFAKLSKEALDELMKPENKEQLKNRLLFHVIPAEVASPELLKMQESSKTLQGTTFRIRIKEGKRQVGNEKSWASVMQTDIKCANGFVHVIDAVMLPIERKDEPRKGKQ